MDNDHPPIHTRLAFPTLGLSTSSLLAACSGGGGILGAIIVVILIATLAAPAVPLVVFPGGEANNKPAALLPFTAEARAVAASPDGTRLYIADTLHNSVAVMDTATRRVTHMIDVGSKPHNIAITPDGTRALVVNQLGGTLSIIDTAGATVTQTLTVGLFPHAIVITADGSTAYVANRGDNSLSVIDLATPAVVTTVDSTTGYNGLVPAALLLTGNGGLFVADRDSNTVTLIDTQTDLVVSGVNVGSAPSGLALAADAGRVYVSNRDSDDVSVLDAGSGVLLATLPVGAGPLGLVTSPDGARVYVAHAYGGREDDLCGLEGTPVRNSVRVIDVATQSVLPGEITVGNAPLAVVITGDNAKLYAVSACNDPVTDQGVVSAAAVGALTDSAALLASSISTVSRGVAAALAPGSEQLYVLHPHALSVIDVATDTVTGAPVAVRGDGPTRLTISNDGTRLFALRPGSELVTVLDVIPGNGLLQRAGSMSVGQGASALIANPAVDELYVSNAGVSRSPGSTLTVLDVTPAGTIDDSPETVLLRDNSVNPATLARGPVALAVNEDHTEVYAAAFGDFFPNTREPGRTLARLTLATRTVTNFDDYGEWPAVLQVDNDADMAATGQVSAGGAGVLYVVDFFNDQVTRGRVSDPNATFSYFTDINKPVAIALAAHRAYVANYQTTHVAGQDVSEIVEIDLDGGITTKTLVGMNPGRLAVTPDEQVAYVLHRGDRSYRCGPGFDGDRYCDIDSRISAITLPFIGTPATVTLNVGRGPSDIAFTPDAPGTIQRALVSNYFDDTVSVIEPWLLDNTTTPTVAATLNVGGGPMGIFVNSTGTRAYVANSLSNDITILDLESTPPAVLDSVSLAP